MVANKNSSTFQTVQHLEQLPIDYDKETGKALCRLFYFLQALVKSKHEKKNNFPNYFTISEVCTQFSYEENRLSVFFDEMKSNGVLATLSIDEGKETYYCFNIIHSSLLA